MEKTISIDKLLWIIETLDKEEKAHCETFIESNPAYADMRNRDKAIYTSALWSVYYRALH